ncbi:hypothetical protein ES703_85407 [subsurface metagenome]
MEAWIITLIGVIVGLVAAFIFYRLLRVGSRLVYQSRAMELIGKVKPALPKEVEILYENKSVPRLMRTHIILWNSGKATLNGEGIAQDDKLRFEFSKDTQVLRVHALKETRKKVNKFKAEVNPDHPNKVIFSFAYLDEGDGVTLEILHTDKEGYPKVKGNIRGLPKGILDWGRFISPRPSRLTKTVMWSMVLFVLAFCLWLIVDILRIYTGTGALLYISLIPLLGVLAMCGFSVWALWWRIRERFPNSLRIEG